MKGLIVTYLMTYGGAAAAVCDPFVGLLIFVAFSIIKPELLWYWSVPPGNYSRTIAVALLIGWVLRGFGRWELGRAWAIAAALLGYWAWAVLGAAMAPDPDLAWGFVDLLSKIALPFLVGVTVVRSHRQLEALAWVIVLSLGYVALELNQSYFGGFNRVLEVGFFGGDNNCAALGMVSGAGLAFFAGLSARRWWLKAAGFAAAALIVHVIFFSFSRGAMLGLAATGLVTFVLIPKTSKHYLIFASALILAARLAGPDVWEEFATVFADAKERDDSAESRLTFWKGCLEEMGRRPILGVGPDHWPLVAASKGWGRMEAHTLWLQIGAELGLPGLSLLLAFYGVCVVRLMPMASPRCSTGDDRCQWLSQGVIASLAGFGISAQFVSLEQLEIPYYLVLIGAGLLKLVPAASAADVDGDPLL